MTTLNIFKWIGEFFTEVLFIPFNFLRKDGDLSWWISNSVNWLFLVVFLGLLYYWMRESLNFKKDGKEDKA
jgi:hypothetical protein